MSKGTVIGSRVRRIVFLAAHKIGQSQDIGERRKKTIKGMLPWEIFVDKAIQTHREKCFDLRHCADRLDEASLDHGWLFLHLKTSLFEPGFDMLKAVF